MYEFLLMSNNNHMSISHRLGDICFWKSSPYLLSLGQNPRPHPTPGPPLPRGDFLNIESLRPCVQGKPDMENKVDWLNTFWAMLLTDRHTDARTHWTQKVIARTLEGKYVYKLLVCCQPSRHWFSVWIFFFLCVHLFALFPIDTPDFLDLATGAGGWGGGGALVTYWWRIAAQWPGGSARCTSLTDTTRQLTA